MESCNSVQKSWQQAAWERLGNAVVERAVLDYIRAAKTLHAHPENEQARCMVKECEDFFCTKRIQLFSAVDGWALFHALQHEAFGKCNKRKQCVLPGRTEESELGE